MFTLLRSFAFALEGMIDAIMLERNFRIEWLAGLMVFLLASLFDFGFWQGAMLVLLVFLVLSLELLNTAIEKICDSTGTAFNENKKRAKDYGAASVLLTAIAAAIIFFGILENQAELFFVHVINHPEAYFFLALIFLLNLPICLGKATFMHVLSAFLSIFIEVFFLFQLSHRLFFLILASSFHGVMVIAYVKLALSLTLSKKHAEPAHK